MASPTQWTWVWVNSGSWWWTGRPGVLWFMGSQRVDTTERLNWSELNWTPICTHQLQNRELFPIIGPIPAGHLTNVPLITHKRTWITFVTTSKNHGGNKMTMFTCWAMLKQSIKGFKDFISLLLPLVWLFYPKLICIRERTTFSEGENMCYFCFMREGTSKWGW